MATCSQRSLAFWNTQAAPSSARSITLEWICMGALCTRPVKLQRFCTPALGLVCLIRPVLGSPAAVAPLTLEPPAFLPWNWSWNTSNASPTGFGCCCLLPVNPQPVSNTKHLLRRTWERREAMSVGGGDQSWQQQALRRVGDFI